MKKSILTICFLLLSGIFGIIYVKSQGQVVENTAANCPNCAVPEQSCRVSGKVINENNEPVSGAKVSSMRTDQPARGRVIYAITNSEGDFFLRNVECGSNIILAEKEEAGYISPKKSLTNNVLPTIYVSENIPITNIDVRIGPKLPTLKGKVVNARTGAAIIDARITLRNANEPDLFFSTNVGKDGEFSLLAPLESFTVVVESPAYQEWQYKNAGGKNKATSSLTLSSGEVLELNVSLKPLQK